jgi:hypothetical protein
VDEDQGPGKMTATIILSAALGISVVILAGAVLVGVLKGSGPLAETSVRILSTALVVLAGVLGFEAGKNTGEIIRAAKPGSNGGTNDAG